MRVISYYTPKYVGEMDRLLKSCRKHDIMVSAMGLPDRGSWERNARAKIPVIITSHLEYMNEDLLWLDADAEVLRPIPWDEVPADTDVGVHFHNRRDGNPSPGTLYVGQTLQAYLFLMEWVERCHGDHTDQDTFNDAVEAAGDVNLWRMPVQWCWIPDIDGPIQDPIIQHHQASRRLRR